MKIKFEFFFDFIKTSFKRSRFEDENPLSHFVTITLKGA